MTTLIKSLAGYYDRITNHSNPFRRMPLKGYANQKFYGEVVLDPSGDVIDVIELGGPAKNGKGTEGVSKIVPFMKDRQGVKPSPNFVWDNTKYALGVMLDAQKNITKAVTKGGDLFDSFKDFHIAFFQNSNDPEIRAFLNFLNKWNWSDYAIGGYPPTLIDRNVAFRLGGNYSYLHDNPDVKRIWDTHLSSLESSNMARCMISGAMTSVSLTHPNIKGVGDQGASLVSFNADAFCSYGKKQNMNAPVSEDLVFKYTTALNSLLSRESNNKIQVGKDLTVVFWAESVSEEEADNYENLLASVFSGGKVDDDTETNELRIALRDVVEGRMKPNMSPDVETETVINILGLTPVKARLQVRFWFRDSFGTIAENLEKHYQDLDFEPPIWNGWKHPPSIWALIREACRDGEKKPNYPLMASGILQSILKGTQFPVKFTSAVLRRIRADREISPRKAALCKAFAVRNFNHSINKETDLMSLNNETAYLPYLLGRLFAIYEYAELKHRDRNKTVKSGLMATAMTNPIKAFPALMKKNIHDIEGLKKSSEQWKKGLGFKLDKILDKIFVKIEPEESMILPGPMFILPNYLDESEQFVFGVAYHHQRTELNFKKSDDSDDQSTTNQGDQNND